MTAQRALRSPLYLEGSVTDLTSGRSREVAPVDGAPPPQQGVRFESAAAAAVCAARARVAPYPTGREASSRSPCRSRCRRAASTVGGS